MAQIAIIGTPGAGKTVFISVLAMRYRIPNEGQPWLEYRNGVTQKYVSDNWDTLTNRSGPDWPPSTPAGTLSRLEWTFHTSTNQPHDFCLRDPAGQDILAIYDSAPENLTEPQKDLKAVIESAEIVLFLLNIRTIIDAPSQSHIDAIEIPLKFAIQDVLTRNTQVGVLLTQSDGFRDYLESLGESFLDPAHVLNRWLPQVGGVLKRYPGRFSVLFTSAVDETSAVTEENGQTYRRPKFNFGSKGLDDTLAFIEWGLNRKQSLIDTENKRQETRSKIISLQKNIRERYDKEQTRALVMMIVGLISLGLFLLFIYDSTTDDGSPLFFPAALTLWALGTLLFGLIKKKKKEEFTRTVESELEQSRLELNQLLSSPQAEFSLTAKKLINHIEAS